MQPRMRVDKPTFCTPSRFASQTGASGCDPRCSNVSPSTTKAACRQCLVPHADRSDLHLSNLLAHDWLASFETTQPELAAAIGLSEVLAVRLSAIDRR